MMDIERSVLHKTILVVTLTPQDLEKLVAEHIAKSQSLNVRDIAITTAVDWEINDRDPTLYGAKVQITIDHSKQAQQG